MSWKETCFSVLDGAGMFENSGHRTRFKELFDCYSSYPFFTKGLCKCIYLSAWDEKHFCIMLEALTELSLGKETDTKEMSVNGDSLAEEQNDDEYYIYMLSTAFLEDRPYHLDDPSVLSKDIQHILSRALEVSACIDKL